MFTYKIIQPFAYSIDAGSLKDAIKNFVKLHYDINMTKIVLAEQDKLYEARLKRYIAESGSHRVGIDVYPYTGFQNDFGFMSPLGSMLSPTGSLVSPYGLPSVLSPLSPVGSVGFMEPRNIGTVINTSSKVQGLPNTFDIPIIPQIDATPFSFGNFMSPDGLTETYKPPPTIINILPSNNI